MINLTQVILVVVITTLTILLSFIGIQVVYILKDLRETIQRVNKVVGHAEAISAAVVRPIAGLGSLVEGIQSSLKIAELLGYVKSHAKKAAHELPGKVEGVREELAEAKQEIGQRLHHQADDIVDEPTPTKSRFPRFFHRGGSRLA